MTALLGRLWRLPLTRLRGLRVGPPWIYPIGFVAAALIAGLFFLAGFLGTSLQGSAAPEPPTKVLLSTPSSVAELQLRRLARIPRLRRAALAKVAEGKASSSNEKEGPGNREPPGGEQSGGGGHGNKPGAKSSNPPSREKEEPPPTVKTVPTQTSTGPGVSTVGKEAK